MTNEQAIICNKNLKEFMRINDKTSEYKFLEDNYIALDMAIQALDRLCSPVTENDQECFTQADGDLISRQDVIDQLHQSINLLEAEDRIRDMPSVAIPNNVGHWIDDGFYAEGHSERAFHCSKCGHSVLGFEEDLSDECPHCGSPMEIER